MAFKRVNSQRRYVRYKDLNPGDVILESGLYLGEQQGTYGVEHLFRETGSDGHLVLNSAAHLNYQLDKCATPNESLCRIIYLGLQKVPKGPREGKEFHAFEVLIDDGADTDVSRETSLKQSESAPTTPASDFSGESLSDLVL